MLAELRLTVAPFLASRARRRVWRAVAVPNLMTTQTPDILTPAEAAQYLRLSRRTVRQMAARGTIPAKRIGKSWRFLRWALTEWMEGESNDKRQDAGAVEHHAINR